MQKPGLRAKSKESRENAKCQQPRANSRIVKHSSPGTPHAMTMPLSSRHAEYSVVKERTRMLGCLLGSIFGSNIFLPSAGISQPCQTGISHQQKLCTILRFFAPCQQHKVSPFCRVPHPLRLASARSLRGCVLSRKGWETITLQF